MTMTAASCLRVLRVDSLILIGLLDSRIVGSPGGSFKLKKLFSFYFSSSRSKFDVNKGDSNLPGVFCRFLVFSQIIPTENKIPSQTNKKNTY